MHVRRTAALIALTGGLFLGTGASAIAQEGQESQDTTRARAGLGGPDQVDRQLEVDREPREALVTLGFLSSYFDSKERIRKRTGLAFSLDYSSMFWGSNESLGAKRASGGMVRLYGSWDLVGRGTDNSGALVFKFEHRHGYTEVTPFGFGFETGYVGLVSAPFSDQGFRWTNLYWRLRLAGGRVVALVGFLDATDFVDVYGFASPWMHNMNLAFSTGSAAIGLPNDAGLGAAVGRAPRFLIVQSAVIDFSHPLGVVAVVLEVLGHGDHLRHRVAEVGLQVVDLRRIGPEAGHQAGPRRRADGGPRA